MRHKQAHKSLIVPVVVQLDEPFDAPELQPSAEWMQHAVGNPDRVWMDSTGIAEEVLSKEMVTANTAAIIRFTYLDHATRLM